MISNWLRNRMIRWLAKGGNGVTLVVDGAWHVTVASAGQVTVTGGQVMARGCQVLQDSTGRAIDARLATEPERFMDEMEATFEPKTETRRKSGRTTARAVTSAEAEQAARLEKALEARALEQAGEQVGGQRERVEAPEGSPAGKKPRKRAAKAPAALPAPVAAQPAPSMPPAGKEPVAAPAAQLRQAVKPSTALTVSTPMPKPLVSGSILGTPGGNGSSAWAKHNAADKRQDGSAKH